MVDHGRPDPGGTRADDGAQARAFFERLRAAPYRFDFYTALRRWECARTDLPRLGESLRSAEDPVRLGQEPSLSFAPSTLAGYEEGTNGHPPRLNVHFFGLFGPNGPLPLHLTEYARDRLRNSDDPTFARFLDLFHHRMLTFFYRAWAQAQPVVSFDRPDEDRFAMYLGALFGMGPAAFRDRDAAPHRTKLYFAGRLACQTKNADGLTCLLSTYFDDPVRLEEFVGQWLKLPESSQCRIGESRSTGLLGRSTIVGSRVWDRQQKFRVRVGPLGFRRFERLLPGGDGLDTLAALTRNYVGYELSFDVKLVLKKEEVPPLVLGSGSRLGWTTWVTSGAPEEDRADLVLDLWE